MPLPLEVEMRLVKELEGAITAFWEPYCFVHAQRHQWIRRWGWKSDFIHVIHAKHWDVLINFYVDIPPKPNGIYQHVGGTSLGLLAGRQTKQTFPFPRLSVTASRFVPRIMRLMPLAVSWFDAFCNSTKCLHQLRTDPNVNPNSPSFKYCEQYLQSLPSAAADGCCLLNLEHAYYDDYCRSQFDVRWRGPLGKMADEARNPQLTVGLRVANDHGEVGTVVTIDPAALDGQGTITIHFDEGYEDTLPLDDSDLAVVEPDEE